MADAWDQFKDASVDPWAQFQDHTTETPAITPTRERFGPNDPSQTNPPLGTPGFSIAQRLANAFGGLPGAAAQDMGQGASGAVDTLGGLATGVGASLPGLPGNIANTAASLPNIAAMTMGRPNPVSPNVTQAAQPYTSSNLANRAMGPPANESVAMGREIGDVFGPNAILRLLGMATSLPGNLSRALRPTPPDQLARQTIDQFAGGPVGLDTRQIVPGSMPTLAEAMTDNNVGVANLQRTVRDLNPQGNIAQRELSNSAARSDFLGNMAGTPADVESARLARSAITDPMRKAAFAGAAEADASGVNRTINQILASPAGQRDTVVKHLQNIQEKLQVENPLSERISDALGPIKDALSTGKLGADRRADFTEARRLLNSAARGHTSEEDLISGLSGLAKTQKIEGPIDNALAAIKSGPMRFQSDPEQLYGIRKAIGDALAVTGPKSEGDARLASSELMTVKDALDRALETAAPGFKGYLEKYTEMSKPINQMEYLQSLNLGNQRGDITLAKVNNALRNIAQDRAAPGTNAAKSLTEDQINGLTNLQSDLHAASNIGIGRAVGSNTVQNIASQNALQSILPGRLGAAAGRYVRPEVAGAAIGGAVGAPFGPIGAATGSSVGAGIGSIVQHGMNARNAEVVDALESMILNPQRYQAATTAHGAISAPWRAGRITVAATDPRLIAMMTPQALSRLLLAQSVAGQQTSP